MRAHGFRKWAENDACRRQTLLEGRRHRHAVKYGIHGNAREACALVQRNAELRIGLEELGIHFGEALRAVLLGLRCGIVGNSLIVDRREFDVRPMRLAHREPMPQGLEAPRRQEFGLTLLARDQSHDVLVEPRRHGVRFNISDEAVLITALEERFKSASAFTHGRSKSASWRAGWPKAAGSASSPAS